MKKLLTVGDSFTYGDELEDPLQAWPYILGRCIDYEVTNQGRSGSSNTSILGRTINELTVNNYDLVVVGWSTPGRIEWKDETGNYDIWPGFSTDRPMFKHHPYRLELLNFINQHHSPQYLYEQYLLQVISLQSFFQAHNIEYRMLNINNDNYYKQAVQDQYTQLSNLIDSDKFIGWNQAGMVQMAAGELAQFGHINVLGHQRVAEKIYEHIRNKCRLS